ncbi:hypothetical protein MRX96_032021 [Rhipicephalus microplus]
MRPRPSSAIKSRAVERGRAADAAARRGRTRAKPRRARRPGKYRRSLDESRLVLSEEYDRASECEEKETATAHTSLENSTEESQSQPADMSTQAAGRCDLIAHGMTRGINTSLAVKRLLEKNSGTAHESKVEGPPAKATPARHSDLRVRSNLPVN